MGRYVHELLRQSEDRPEIEWRLYGDDPRHPLYVPAGMRGEIDVFPFRGDRFQGWEQVGLPRRVRSQPVDILHCTEGSLPWWQPVPTVVTLHDTLAWQEHDGSAFSRFYFDRLLPAALARCAAVITISESSRRDIVAMWPALEPKITVIPHGIGDEYLSDSSEQGVSELQASLQGRPYIAYLGGPLPRKRFDWALEVLRASGLPSLELVACGFGAAARDNVRSKLPAELAGRVHFAPFLSDKHLLSLYKGARAVLYPTLYEGFGFPAIEAQAAGAPVIFSPVSSLAELVGPLTLAVDTTDLSGWVAAVRKSFAMGTERVVLAAEARQWAQGFSWQRSFEAHRRVYLTVADQRQV